MEKALRITGLVFMALSLIGAVIWVGREAGWWTFEYLESITIPIVACGVIGLILSRIRLPEKE